MSKYTEKEREELCKKYYINDHKTVNLMPYKYELRDWEDRYSVSVDSPDANEVEIDGVRLDDLWVTHYPTFRELHEKVQEVLNNPDYNLTLDDVKLDVEEHHLDGWDDGPFQEIKVTVNIPRTIEEIEAIIDEKLENKRKWDEIEAKEAQDKEAKEKKLLEELKEKYE